MDLKHILRQINSDGDNIPLHGSTPGRGSTTASLHRYDGAGVVHPIRSDGINTFSETDFTEDEVIDVPTLVMHGDDDQILPIDHSAKLAIQLLKQGELKIYLGLSHGIATVNARTIDADLLIFVQG